MPKACVSKHNTNTNKLDHGSDSHGSSSTERSTSDDRLRSWGSSTGSRSGLGAGELGNASSDRQLVVFDGAGGDIGGGSRSSSGVSGTALRASDLVFQRARSRLASAGEGAFVFLVNGHSANATSGRGSVLSGEAEGRGALDEGPGSVDVTAGLGGTGHARDLICGEVGSDADNAGGGACGVRELGSPIETISKVWAGGGLLGGCDERGQGSHEEGGKLHFSGVELTTQ